MTEQELEKPKQKMKPAVKDVFVDNVLKKELDKIKHRVLKKDHDWVCCIDGDEGSGKSVLAMQVAMYLDPKFNIDRVVFNSDDFLKAIKDPKIKQGSCILLDEAFSAANSRSSMTEVNKSMVGVATEMRQKNLFVIIVLPSFFDLDRYFAIHRTNALLHVYLDANFNRGQYIIFPKTSKKYLYLMGKKTYSYAKPQSPYPPCSFPNQYAIDELEYRLKKSQAFTKRTVSNQARNWMLQRNAYIKYIFEVIQLTQDEIGKLPANFGARMVGQRQMSTILRELAEER